jgi:hypothetical protein
MPNLPESLLALIAGSDRAAAILGDLTEMAATRGRLWFWTAFTRTLISLGWRTPVAFVFAIASVRFIFGRVLPLLENHRITHLRDAGLFGVYNPHLRLVTWNTSMVISQCLFFALPFAIVRFGLRNRVTQLACSLLLLAAPVYTLRPWVMDLSGLLTALAVAAALLFPHCRRPMIVLTTMCFAAIAAVVTCVYILVTIFHQNFFTLSASKMSICDDIGLALAVVICLYLNRRLLRQRPAIA